MKELIEDPKARTASVLAEVAAARLRQTAKHGDQAHLPDGTGPQSTPLQGIVYDGPVTPQNGCRKYAWGLALLAKESTDRRSQSAGDGTVTFADILLEEVFEAMAEDDQQRLRTELVQAAAVCVQWVEAIDRRSALLAEGGAA